MLNKNNLDEDGKYLTSFLEIFINTERELDNLALLSDQDQGTYFHEYLHYIQDVTTCFGLSKIWNSFDRFRQLVASIQPTTITEIDIPLQGPAALEQKSHIDFFKKLRGSGQMQGITMEIADTYKIVDVEFQKEPKIAEYFPTSDAEIVKLHLKSEDHPNRFFVFGEAAISETMAYQVEKKFYPNLKKLPRYPYKVAYDLVKFLYPKFLIHEENLFALCDISLMHNVPGWAFVKILSEIKRKRLIPNRGEDVIQFGYGFYSRIRWNFDAYMKTAEKSLRHISSQIFAHPLLKPTLILFQVSIERGRLLRKHSPYAVLNIYQAANPLSFNFYKLFNFLGGPHAVNRIGKRVVRVPDGLNHLSKTVHPQHFRVIWQLSKFLMEGQRPCSLYHICVASENKVPVDDRCEHSPWKRAEDEYGCPYAAFWGMFGFRRKDFYLNGALIQQKV